jgi:outer membrane protein assembly factor BamA
VDVYPGPLARFGSITVEGNEKLDETVIRRMLPFREGSRYRQELIFQGQRNLFSLELLRLADITQDLDNQPDSLVPVTVRVAEGNTHRVRTGLGWTSAECLTAEARWSSRNFLGGARRMQFQGRVANLLAENLRSTLCDQAGTEEYGELNWLVGADFTQPFLFSSRNSLSAGLYAERQSLQDVFVRQALGLNLLVNRSIGRGSFLSASFRPQVGQLDAAEVFFCTSYAVCEPDDIEALQGTNTLSPVGIGVTQDLVNQLLNPTSGRRLLLEIEHASAATGSDYGYDRVIGEMVGYWGVGSTVVAGRLRGGVAQSPPLPGEPGSRGGPGYRPPAEALLRRGGQLRPGVCPEPAGPPGPHGGRAPAAGPPGVRGG